MKGFPVQKAYRAVLALVLLAGVATPLRAQDITANGVARSASLMRQLIETCADKLALDVDMAARSEKAFVEAGQKAFGKQKFAAELARERPRRAQEAQDAGADDWCAVQRQRVIEIGGAALFRK